MSNIFGKKNPQIQKKFRKKELGKLSTLAEAEIGETYVVCGCSLPEESKIRFYEMGLTPQTEIKLLRKAPAGDPLELEVRGYLLCIRKKDAQRFCVKKSKNR